MNAHPQSLTQRLAGGGTFVALLMILNLAAAPAAHATFGGENGDLAYVALDPTTAVPGSLHALRTIFTVARGQLLHPVVETTEEDLSPAYSPDGTMLAFIADRGPAGQNSVELMNPDGSGRHSILLGISIGPGATIEHVTWLSDGTLALEVLELGGGNYANSIYVMNADGSGLYQALQTISPLEPTMYEIDGSPVGRRVVYRCRYRATLNGALIDDYCIFDLDAGVTRLPVNDPLHRSLLYSPHWTPDGERIVYVSDFAAPDPVSFSIPSPYGDGPIASGTTGYTEQQAFTVNRDGTDIRQLTSSSAIVWWNIGDNGVGYGVANELDMYEALMAPDGRSLTGSGLKKLQSGDEQIGLWSIQTGGDDAPALQLPLPSILHSAGSVALDLAWQPKPTALALFIQDGHGNPLEGLTLELRRHGDQTLIMNRILNTSGGRYVFDDPVAPGEYDVRAILKDKCLPQDCTPAFDIRYGPEPAQPVQMDFDITVTVTEHLFQLSFVQDDPYLLGYNIASSAGDRLDDMANIFFRMHQFVTWLHGNLTPDTGPTVKLYTFAKDDPFQSGVNVKNLGAYYDTAGAYIVLSEADSDVDNRTSGPENDEWHEFSHHMWFTFVATDPSCAAGSVAHLGYNNPTTCDSLEEGFASFLANFAANDIRDSRLVFHLEDNTVAWQYSSSTSTEEDIAVASLLWDLTDGNVDGALRSVIGADGITRSFAYQDKFSMSLTALWSQLIANSPKTVQALHTSFGPQTPTIDLDGDGSPDVSLLDEVFLMHGFYPVDQNPTAILGHDAPFYNVGYAPQSPDEAVNAEVGQSAHHIFIATNPSPFSVISPRPNIPLIPHSEVHILLKDAAGQPLTAAKLHFVYRSDTGDEDTVIQPVSSADNHVYLELPPYFDYLLPEGAAFPACDPANDRHEQVTISAEANGIASTESPTLDNCTYWQAIQTATEDTAVTYTLTVPTTITAPNYRLTLYTEGNGTGSVTGAGSYVSGQSASVSAAADAGSEFSGWTGFNATECASGAVVMNAEKSCIANFVIKTFKLTLNATGNGSGVLVGAGTYQINEQIEVRAVPDAASSFAGWSGTDAAECTTGLVTMTVDKTCTAIFSAATYTLTLSTTGTGSGTVTGAGVYNGGQAVPVTAVAAGGSTFAGWSGANGAECASGTVVMTANKSCTATMTAVVISTVTVPNVVGLTQAAATAAVANAGLVVGGVTTQVSVKVAGSSVLGESPKAGSTARVGSAVALTVARNLEACDVDGNGRIDHLDVLLVTLSFGSKPLGPFDPRDADGNGVINARDVLKCSKLCRDECKL